jgi:hypothetical protein
MLFDQLAVSGLTGVKEQFAMDLDVRVFTIGALAKATGVSTPTIRYYEEIGLLPRANRTTSGQRSYDQDDLGRLTFIKQCLSFEPTMW